MATVAEGARGFGFATWCAIGLAGGAAGVLAGLGSTLVDVQGQGYIELGFGRTMLELASESAARSGIAGALLGLALGAILWALCVCVPPLRAFLSPAAIGALFRDARERPRGYLTIMALGLLALAIAAQFGGPDFGRGEMFSLVVGTAAALLAYAVASRATASGRAAPAAAAGALALAAVFVLAYMLRRGDLYALVPLRTRYGDLGTCAAALLALALTVAALRGLRKGPQILLVACALVCAVPAALWVARRAGLAPGIAVERPWNVIVIGIDTLREDHTSLDGEGPLARKTTPVLDALAARGIRYSQAIAQAPWTLPSFASILTGKYPHQHGALSLSSRLRPEEITLAEVLREAGYATGGVVSHLFLDRKHGFDQGCTSWHDDQALGHDAVTSGRVTDEGLAFVRANADRPFFLFAHYFDPHYEYHEHEGYGWAKDYQGWWRDQMNFDNLQKNRNLLEERDIQWMRDLYDEEIAFTDKEIGRLLDGVSQLGLSDRTLIVVVADHGEEFADHGNFGHTTTLFEELLHVPLLVVRPQDARAGTVVAETVETRSVFATVLDALGVDFALQTRPQSLLQIESGDAAREHLAFSNVWLPTARLEWGKRFEIAALRRGKWKLIEDRTRGITMLFDLEADPGEKRNLADTEADQVAQLKPLLDTWLEAMLSEHVDSPGLAIDGELAKKLKQLGYM